MKPKPRFLCVFGTARTGSSLLYWILEAIPELNASPSIFHAKHVEDFSAAEVDALNRRAGFDISDRAAFLAWRKDNPAAALEALYEGGGGRVVTCRLHPRQLTTEAIESQILSRDDVAFAIHRRRPIESFISGTKAHEIGVFQREDTTVIKPEISVDAFVEWAEATWQWFRWCENAVRSRSKPFVRISYERDLNCDHLGDAVDNVLRRLRPLSLGHLSKPANFHATSRQDLEPHYRDRVANWADFERSAQENSRTRKLLEWAQRTPI